MWHKTDLYAEEFSPESIKMPFRPWIFENDAEKVAIQKVAPSLSVPVMSPSRYAFPIPTPIAYSLSPPLSFPLRCLFGCLRNLGAVIYIYAFEIVG